MRHFLVFYSFLAAFLPFSVAQTDGWTSTCPPTYPSVSEVMIDACGDEFRSEYVVLRTKSASFDIRNFGFSVSNPFNSAFIGSVAVTNTAANADALQALNTAAGVACGYGTVFRNAFSTPYNGIIPPNSTILVFNNRDSTDVTYLSPNALSRLCGSKVFVVFGTLTAQSRGVSIFRNYPQNGSCGTTGCLRKIDFSFNGQTCTQLTYDIKKLPNLNTSNPPVGFNEGSYLLPNPDNTLTYGGGNLTGAGVNCMPTARLACVIPPVPTYGDGFWNVMAFDGQNTYNTTDFKGFYAANDHEPTTIPADTINGSFEFNTAFDGWKTNSSPSEAVELYGAKTTYDGCNVRADSFSILAKRQGFPCGFYKISWKNYDDNARIRLDADGNGVFEYDQMFNAPSCSAGCGGTIWQGDLGARSRMEIYSSEQRGNFNVHLIFQKDTVGHPSVKVTILGTTALACGGAPTGSISTAVTGGTAPYAVTWRGATAIPSGTLMPSGLPSGIFHITAIDALGCADSAQILVPQTNNITVQAFGDTTFCPNSTAILRGVISGGNGTLTANWLTSTSETIVSTSLNFSPKVSKSTTYVLRATDASGCVKTDTVVVKTHDVRKVRVTLSPNDTICNDEVTVFTARGSNNYTWTSFPQIGTAALNPQNATATLYALFLPAPVYTFYAAGQDANGCRDTGSAKIWINPLPVVTITPVLDTLCDDAPPHALVGTPATGGRFYSRTCGNCVENGFFYPNRAGIGAHEVQHELIDANGCRNAPSILIKVKNCRCLTSVAVPIDRAICSGDSIRIKNLFYKTAGFYRDTFIKTDGCDSVVILNLSIKTKDTTRLNAKVCPPLTARIDTVFFKNINSCDSMVITTKTVARRDSTLFNYLLCNGDSVRVNGNWIKKTGETRLQLVNTEGCDSTLIVNISFSRRDTILQSATTCNRLNVGIDTVKLRNALGCDSIVITTTRLNKLDTTRLVSTTCNTLDSGTTVRRLQNQFGCDSIIIQKTTLSRRDSIRLNATICRNDSLRFGNLWLKTAGIYSRNLVNTEGCDSTIILTLQVQKTDTTVVLKTSCNPALVGDATQILRSSRGCDSVVITRTSLAQNTLSVSLTVSESINCNGDSNGSVKILNPQNLPPQYRVLWSNGRNTLQIDSLRAGLYSIVVTDSLGCTARDSIRLTEPPPIVARTTGIAPRCFTESLGAIKIDSIQGGTAPYTLIFKNNRSNITLLPHRLDSVRLGYHILQIIDNKGCRIETTVEVPEAPDRSLELGSDRRIVLGESTTLSGFINFAAKNLQWTWTPKDSSVRCATCLQTLVKPTQTTVYTLLAQDSAGCSVSDNITIFVHKPRNIFIPTTFSPNNDLMNDRFTIFGDASVRRVQSLRIFNRWGNPLFDRVDFPLNDETAGWDGSAKGLSMPPDVYIYVVVVEFIDGKVIMYKGDITLIK